MWWQSRQEWASSNDRGGDAREAGRMVQVPGGRERGLRVSQGWAQRGQDAASAAAQCPSSINHAWEHLQLDRLKTQLSGVRLWSGAEGEAPLMPWAPATVLAPSTSAEGL